MAEPARRWCAVTGRHPPSAERPRRITVLGSTGSVGRSTLDLVAEAPEMLSGRGADRLSAASRRLRPSRGHCGAQLGGDRRSGLVPRAQGAAGRQRDRGRGRARGGRGGGPAAGRMGHGRHRRCRGPARRPWPPCGAAPWSRSPTRNAWSAPARCDGARCAAMGATLLPVDSRAQRDLPGPCDSDAQRASGG